MKRRFTIGLVLMLFSGILAGCTQGNGPGDGNPSEKQKTELIIAAASSLKDAMEELKGLYEAQETGVTLTFTFDSSGTLQQQIEQGAPVDLFVSAAMKQMSALKEKGLIVEESMVELLENKVVLICAEGITGITSFEDLAKDSVEKIALGEPSSVPVGQYAEEILSNLGIQEAIQPKVVYGKNVREVLSWVETGNAEVGVVYATDAKISDKVVTVTEAPQGSHSPVIYPAAVMKASENQEVAQAFLKFLLTEEAEGVFEKYGYSMVK